MSDVQNELLLKAVQQLLTRAGVKGDPVESGSAIEIEFESLRAKLATGRFSVQKFQAANGLCVLAVVPSGK